MNYYEWVEMWNVPNNDDLTMIFTDRWDNTDNESMIFEETYPNITVRQPQWEGKVVAILSMDYALKLHNYLLFQFQC